VQPVPNQGSGGGPRNHGITHDAAGWTEGVQQVAAAAAEEAEEESELSDGDVEEGSSDAGSDTGLFLEDLPLNLDDDKVLDAGGGGHEDAEESSGAEDADDDRNDENAAEEEAPVAEEPGGSVCGGSSPPTSQGAEQQGSLKTNGVTLSADEFESHVEDFAAFSFPTDNGISRSGAEAFLKQRMNSSLKRRSLFLLNQLIHEPVHLEEKVVDCCRNGCLAYTGERSQQTVCGFCKADRFYANRKVAKTTRYFNIAALMNMMLANPDIGPDMMDLMRKARLAAASGSRSRDDWYKSDIFRILLAMGKFSSDTDVAQSIWADGFEAWRQGGFQG